MRIDLVATVRCSKCDTTHEFRAGAEEETLDTFGRIAKLHFRRLGWRCLSPHPEDDNLCPIHNNARIVAEKH